MTTTKIDMERYSVISSKPFEAVVESLKAAVERPDMVEFAKAIKDVRNFIELESAVQRGLGRTGFMMFMELDHGAILRKGTCCSGSRLKNRGPSLRVCGLMETVSNRKAPTCLHGPSVNTVKETYHATRSNRSCRG